MSGQPFTRTRSATVDCDCPRYYDHGNTTHGYHRHRCGCDDYLTALRAERAHRRVNGSTQVPADPARAHIKKLIAAGITQAEIARRTGYNPQTINSLHLRGKRVDALIAEDILTLTAAS